MGKEIGSRFVLKRNVDDSGVSGTGYVAFGIVLPSGKVVIEWTVGTHRSIEIHNSIADCMAIHGHGDHTITEWVDAENYTT